jgi:hypothetical protein
MPRIPGLVALALSACGYPLTRAVIRRWGVPGAAVAETLCAGLPPLLRAPSTRAPAGAAAGEDVRRAAVAMLFALHTVRFARYLSPGQGRRC